jgi:mono/diheme cytochrome c family protein
MMGIIEFHVSIIKFTSEEHNPMSITKSTFVCLLLLTLIIAACGPSDTPEASPTDIPEASPTDVPDAADSEMDDTTTLVGDPASGESIYKLYCLECHSIDSGVNIAGPSFYAAGDRLTYDYVEESMRDPHKVTVFVDDPQRPDAEMPTDFKEEFTEQEFTDVIAYIMSLSSEGVASVPDADSTTTLVGDSAAGELIYTEYCLECHSIDSGVNIAGPSFYAAGDRLSYDYVKESMRDPHKVEVFVDDPQKPDEEMPTDFLEVFTEQEFEDVIAYIMSLSAE